MSSVLLDAGDRQRIERDMTLTDQLPRQEIQDDKSPVEDMEFDLMLEGLMMALERRINE